MRFEGPNPRRTTFWACLLALSICLVFGLPSAGATGVSLDTPLVGVDVDLDNGAGVDVSVPAAGTDVSADVDVGDGGVSVDANVNTPATSGSGSGSDSGGSSSGSSSGGKESHQDSPAKSDSGSGSSPKGSAAVNSPKVADGTNGTRGSDSRSTGPGGSPSSAATSFGLPATGGLVALVTANRRAAPVSATNQGEDASVVAQLVEYIPTWLWIALGLLAIALALTAAFALHQYRRRRAADGIALQDPLTDVANVKAFDMRLSQEWARARRHHSGLGVLMIDLDRFKEVNDTRGHATGDRVLIATASALRRHTRESDLVARVGGDEFAVICPETGLRGLKKLRANLEQDLPREIGFGVGLSIGVAAMRQTDEGPSDMVTRADSKMYETKSERKAAREATALAHVG